MTKTISQREARALRRRVEELESAERQRRHTYARDYPGGVNIATQNYSAATEFLPAVVHNSRKLGHAVVCVADGARILYFALPHPREPA